MSIYGGFGTRAEENNYGKLTEKLISTLCIKANAIISQGELDDLE